jgi:uncharacterized protein
MFHAQIVSAGLQEVQVGLQTTIADTQGCDRMQTKFRAKTMHSEIVIHQPALNELCKRYGVQTLDVFGSAARSDDFSMETSDIDLLVEFEPGRPISYTSWTNIQDELQALFKRPVDLLSRSEVENSRNYIRRKRILREAKSLYDARQ